MEAICAILGVCEEFVLNEVVRLGLATPPSFVPHRRPSTRVWSFSEIGKLILGWTAALSAKTIGEVVNRSAGAIYYKVRSLGLPKRSRSQVLANKRNKAISNVLGSYSARSLEITSAEGKRIEIGFVKGRRHIKWSPSMDYELSRRHWAYQRLDVVAAEWGVSTTTLTSRANRLELPSRERALLVAHFDPNVVEANIAAANYVLRKCRVDTAWSFWAHRNGPRISRRGEKIRARNGGGYGLGISHAVPSIGASFSL